MWPTRSLFSPVGVVWGGLLALLLAVACHPAGRMGAEAIYAEKSFYVKSYATVFQKFGFEQNGTFALTSASFDPPQASKSVFFYLCDAHQWLGLWSRASAADIAKGSASLCASPPSPPSASPSPPSPLDTHNASTNATTEVAGVCELSHLSFDDDRLKNYTVRTSSLYYFVALRCFGESDGGVSGGESDEEGKRSALPRVVDIDEEGYEQVKQDALLTLKMQAQRNDLQERIKNDKQGYPIDVVEMTISYTLLQPGGRHLSVGSAPLPMIYSVFVAWWSWLTMMYGLILFIKTKSPSFSLWTPPGWGLTTGSTSEQVVSLHWVLELVVISKLVVELSGMFYWRICDSTGYCYVQLAYFQSFIFALSESLLFAVLLLVAKGWKITRSKLPLSEIRSITVALLLLLSTLLFFSIYNESYYFFSILIMYIFMLPKIFTAVTKNLKRLNAQFAFISRLGNNRALLRRHLTHMPRISTLKKKIRLFQFLKATVGLYLSSFVVLSLLKMMMPWRVHWVNNLLQETSSVIVIGVIIYLLAPDSKLFSRSSMFDEDSLPWLQRNILQRLLEGEDGADGLLFLMGGEAEDDTAPAKVDFGDGHSGDLSELVVFEYPHQPAIPAHKEEQEKGKTIESEADKVGGGASARYLVLGVKQQFVDREAAEMEREREQMEKVEALRAARRERRRRRRARHAPITRSRLSRLLAEAESHQREADEDTPASFGEADGEIEMVDLSQNRRSANDSTYSADPEDHIRGAEEEECDLETGTERRALLRSTSSS